MARTINNFIGWETGGIEEASATVGAGTFVQSTFPDPPSPGKYFLIIDDGGNQEFDWAPFAAGVSNAGDDHIIAGWYAPDWDSDTEVLFTVRDASNVQIIALRTDHTPTREIQVRDAADADVGSATHAFSDDTWHFIELVFQNNATGSATLFMDGVLALTIASEDFSGTIDHVHWEVILGTGRIHADDVYWLSGCAGINDRLGPCEVRKYQSLKTGQVPDDGGDSLNTNDWDDCGTEQLSETLLSIYTTTGAGAVDADATNGSPEGPVNDPDIDGDIIAMSWVARAQRGSGGSSSHYGLIGNDVGGTERTRELALAQNSLENRVHVSVSSLIPTKNQHCRFGFETTGARNFECATMWMMLFHRPIGLQWQPQTDQPIIPFEGMIDSGNIPGRNTP